MINLPMKSGSGALTGGGGGRGGLGAFFGGGPAFFPITFGGRPSFLRGGLCIREADVDVVDAMGVPGDVERELDEASGSKDAMEESRSLEGILDCEFEPGR